jgi:capsular polysaccharide biosynthesis protein
MKRRIFMIVIAVLPVLMFMAGCGGGYAEQEYTPNPNEQHIYVHQMNDPTYDMYLQQQMQRQSMQDYQRSLDRTMNCFDESLRRMHQNNMDSMNMLNNARQQRP